MAVLRLTAPVESDYDRNRFLMRDSIDYNEHEYNHVIDLAICDSSSSLASQGEFNGSHEMYNEDRFSISSLTTTTHLTSSATASRSASLTRRGENHGLGRRNPLDSGLCVSVMLFVNVTQIVAAVVVLSLSTHEHPRAPLFAWVIGYIVGCVANLPRLYWRYIHPNNQAFDQESTPTHQHFSSDNSAASTTYTVVSFPQDMEGSVSRDVSFVSRLSQNILASNSRLSALIGHLKMALECYFVVWFVVGNVWVFGSHSSVADAPNLYRLCIVFLTFSCIGYAMPFILCATICCCFPCIISVLGFREDLPFTRGATSELINALPIYKFKSQRSQNRCSRQTSVGKFEGGILAAGADQEQIVSSEDAACCICLATYAENDELRELPCAHFFHAECVDKWLKINALCPLCKSIVVATAGFSSLISSLLNTTDQYRRFRHSADIAENIV